MWLLEQINPYASPLCDPGPQYSHLTAFKEKGEARWTFQVSHLQVKQKALYPSEDIAG